MSAPLRVPTIVFTGLLTGLLASSAASGAIASAQDVTQPRADDMMLAQAVPADDPVLRPAGRDARDTSSATVDESQKAEGPAYPPSPMQTATAIGGALLAILLAILGVTVTFRMMREERRRGRGRSRRSTAMTPQS